MTGYETACNGPPALAYPTVASATRVLHINDGSPDAGAIKAFNTLMGKNVPVGWSATFWEDIGSKVSFNLTGSSTTPTLVVQPYPTYHVYQNGRYVITFSQAPTPKGNFWTKPYPFGTVNCWGDGGLTPGGRCGDAVSPPDLSARVPDYILP